MRLGTGALLVVHDRREASQAETDCVLCSLEDFERPAPASDRCKGLGFAAVAGLLGSAWPARSTLSSHSRYGPAKEHGAFLILEKPAAAGAIVDRVVFNFQTTQDASETHLSNNSLMSLV